MNRRKVILLTFILFVIALLGILIPFMIKKYKIRQAVRIYHEFIDGKRTADGWDIFEISTPTGEPQRRYATSYTIWDVTGDGIPELHIIGGREYLIFSVKSGEMFQFSAFFSEISHYHLLKNGAFLYSWCEKGYFGYCYNYFELDDLGEPVNEKRFSWADINDNHEYDEDDEYIIDEAIYTQTEWFSMTREYLYTDVMGNEQIRNEVEWVRYCSSK